ncbi:hypothetical protein HHL19_22180 [Streptomyces sp. R302]|nr:hypothetical protein [Streptomyces sp. R301]NML81295.1 hypothetical protein [Streptomyces sp. R302]
MPERTAARQPPDDRGALARPALSRRRGREVLTSERVAASVSTHPVIIRRSLGELRRAGLVRIRHGAGAGSGAGAGWSRARAPERITLLDVYDAVDAQPPFGLHRTEPHLKCPVGRGIRPALGGVYGRVEAALREELAGTTIADVLRESAELIELSVREFVESEEAVEAVEATVLGQFRDLDDPDRFVWLRGFEDMARRTEALESFYGGPVWAAHRDKTNATMADSDDVLLLRPASAGSGFPLPARTRPAPGEPTAPPRSLVLATIWYGHGPFDEAFVEFFPALPVRLNEKVFVWFAHFAADGERPAPDAAGACGTVSRGGAAAPLGPLGQGAAATAADTHRPVLAAASTPGAPGGQLTRSKRTAPSKQPTVRRPTARG